MEGFLKTGMACRSSYAAERKAATLSSLPVPGDLRLPLHDGLIGDADTIFSLLIGYLSLLGAAHAEVVELVCDGAEWIWERAERLVTEARIPREKLVEAVDFYHASEYLSETLKMRPHVDEEQTPALFRELRHVLRHQGASPVMEELKKLAGPSEEMATRIAYFDSNIDRMHYQALDGMKLSVGSGRVESCIRRTINPRFKFLRDAHAVFLSVSYPDLPLP